MGRVHRKRYTAEFKAEAVRLVQTSDRRVTEIAEHLGVTTKTLHEWVRALRPPAPDRLTCDVIHVSTTTDRSHSVASPFLRFSV